MGFYQCVMLIETIILGVFSCTTLNFCRKFVGITGFSSVPVHSVVDHMLDLAVKQAIEPVLGEKADLEIVVVKA